MIRLFRFFQINKRYLISLPRSIYLNFRLLPFRQAIRCPIFVSNRVVFNSLKGSVRFEIPLHAGMIKIGYPTSDFFSKKEISVLAIDGDIFFRGRAQMGCGLRLSVGENSCLVVGKNFWLTGDALIVVRKCVEFETNCVLSWGITIMDHDAHDIFVQNECVNVPKPIFIGEHTWVGCNTMLLKGCALARNSIVGAGSVIVKEHKTESVVICGNPGVEKKKDVSWSN